jgi:orotate phosphoribosyltransferase
MTADLVSHDTLIRGYVEAGILQFGRFQQADGDFLPIAMNFLLLPSYPHIMQQTAKALVPLVHQSGVDRLLTTRATTPLGAVLAVESGIPMTYPYGEAQSYTHAFVIEGAYDVGHPTALLTDVLKDELAIHELVESARKVGLTVNHLVCLFTLGKKAEAAFIQQNITVHPLLDFRQVVDALTDVLPTSLRSHLVQWLAGID